MRPPCTATVRPGALERAYSANAWLKRALRNGKLSMLTERERPVRVLVTRILEYVANWAMQIAHRLRDYGGASPNAKEPVELVLGWTVNEEWVPIYWQWLG